MTVEETRQHESVLKPSHWRWRLMAIGLPVLLAGVAANHIEYACRQRRVKAAAATGSLVVRAESGALGHNQIGIDEAYLTEGREQPMLRFSLLGSWEYDSRNPSPCPAKIQKLSGREAACVGFMYPLETGTRLRLFCLLRTTQTCCYGPRPQFSQYLFVEMKEPVKFERLAPVVVAGKFFVDPQPDQGFIYRMEGKSVSTATDEEPDTDATKVALAENEPLFDFAPLGQMTNIVAPYRIPATLLSLDGKIVVVGGFVVARKDEPTPHVVVARDWWDGRGQGKLPTMFTALSVFLKSSQEITPAWKQNDVFVGTLHVNQDPASWARDGILSLHKAARACSKNRTRPLTFDLGPFMPLRWEVIVLSGFILLCLRTSSFRRILSSGKTVGRCHGEQR